MNKVIIVFTHTHAHTHTNAHTHTYTHTHTHAHAYTHVLQADIIEFHNIRVDDPSLLLINGQRLSQDKLAQSTVSITAFS